MGETKKRTTEEVEVSVEQSVVTTEPVEQSVAETEEVKPYEFRLLNAPDIMLMVNIISKIGINEFMAVFSDGGIVDVVKSMMNGEKKIEKEDGEILAFAAVALDVVNIIFGNLHKCEKEIYQLLAQTSNLSVEEITADGNAVMFFEMIIDFFRKDEFPSFFKVVSKFLK